MTNFKDKLDDMMGDTSKQEARISQGVRAKMQNQQIKPKRSWQMPAVATAFVALIVFLVATYNFSEMSSNEGRGVPYDPLVDLYEIQLQRQDNTFSNINYDELLTFPTISELSTLQYIDREMFELNGMQYHTVIERQQKIFSEVVYGQGDIVRTMTNTGSHLPIYDDEYYEIVAVPGDRVELQNGRLTVNGKKVQSDLMDYYEENNIAIAGGYDQLLNAREYVLLNRFPAKDSLQPLTINAVHKIYGKVVGITEVEKTDSIYIKTQFEGTNYSPEQYFDRYLYDLIFGDGTVAQFLTVGNKSFPLPTRTSEYFLEAGYRKVEFITDEKVEIRYSYGLEGSEDHVFYMYKMPNSGIWQWGL